MFNESPLVSRLAAVAVRLREPMSASRVSALAYGLRVRSRLTEANTHRKRLCKATVVLKASLHALLFGFNVQN